MKKVILVQPENGLNEAVYAPLGLLSLASYVRDDFDVEIVDLRLSSLPELYKKIEEKKPIAVGFSMLTGSCILQIIEAGRKIKIDYPETKVIVGGIHPTFFPEQTLEHPVIDFAVINEGERTLKALLNAIQHGFSFGEISNLGWKENGNVMINKIENNFIDMNDLPEPAWDLIPVEKYVKALSRNPGEKVLNFYTSKGCPFPCSFCYNLNFNHRKWRSKSAEKAVNELEFLNKKYGVNYFIVHDDNFVVDRERALEFARLLKRRKLNVKYSIDARVDYFDFDFLKKLKESGMTELRVGCESGSNRVLLKIIQKGITAEQTLKAVEVAKSLDLKLMLSFVIGWPTETLKERQETIDLIMKLQRIYKKAAIYPLWIYIPYPGTTLFNKALELGFKAPQSLVEWGSYFWGKARLPWIKNQKEYELIHALSPFVWYVKGAGALADKSPKIMARHFLIKALRIPFVLRFKNNYWKWPYEALVAMWLKNLILK